MARPKKPEFELMDQRVVLMMTKSELESLDDWSFANRIRSRGEAIRRLCAKALYVERKQTSDKSFARMMAEAAEESVVE